MWLPDLRSGKLTQQVNSMWAEALRSFSFLDGGRPDLQISKIKIKYEIMTQA